MAAKDDDAEVSQEEARELLIKLLGEAGAEVDVEQERKDAAKAASDAVDRRPDAKPLLGFDSKRADPPLPSVGRAPRKKK